MGEAGRVLGIGPCRGSRPDPDHWPLPSPSSASFPLLLGNPPSPSSGPGRASLQMAGLRFSLAPPWPLATKPCPRPQQTPSTSPGVSPQADSARPMAPAGRRGRQTWRGNSSSSGPGAAPLPLPAKGTARSWSFPVSLASGHPGRGQSLGQNPRKLKLLSWKL